jgi:hypothetical protein
MRRRDVPQALVATVGSMGLAVPPARSQSAGENHYPRTAAEAAAGVTPTDFSCLPGSLQRYGADPTGARDSSPAWTNAIKANSRIFDDFPGGGSYRLASEVVISRFPITIKGSAKNIGSGTGGTQVTLAAAAGPGKACMRTTAFASCVRIEQVRFAWERVDTGQLALRFAGDLRSSRILDCGFVGRQSSDCNLVGIQLDGTGTYTGDITVRDNYFSGLLLGVDVRGSCTTVRILENELYGYVSGAASYGVRVGNRSTETLVAFNDMEGWTRGIYSEGGYVKQLGNTYEANEHNFEWQRGSGNDRIWNISLAETFVSGGAPLYPMNDQDKCVVLSGPGIADFDVTTLNAARGFRERRRSAPLGEFTTEVFSSGNYSCAGGGTWTVAARHQTTFQYSFVGLTMLISWRIEGSTLSGSPNTVQIAIPQFRAAQQAVGTTCYVNDGKAAIACADVERNGRTIRVFKVDRSPFAAGTFTTYGQISFEIT